MDIMYKKALQVACITTAIYLYLQARRKKEDKSLPPIAPGYLPIVGHLLSISKPLPAYKIFDQWSKQVGPICTVYFGSQRWIILNSYDAIKDLIIDRGAVYSSRNLPTTILDDFGQGDKGGAFIFFGYTKSWRQMRRLAHNGLTKNRINERTYLSNKWRIDMLSHLWDLTKGTTGIDVKDISEHFAATSTLTTIYGPMFNFQPGDPKPRTILQLAHRMVQSATPADQLNRLFPLLGKLLPSKSDKYLKLRDDFAKVHSSMFKQFKDKYIQDPDSVGDCLLKEIIELDDLTDLKIQHFIGMISGAAALTLDAAIGWTFAFLANHPEVQEKAYKEIKQVVGTERLPDVSDEHLLPYVQCTVLEILRIRPSGPLSIPHSNSEEDVYNGWTIPKDTTIILNLFSVNHDGTKFHEPEKFNPDRHMDYVLASKNGSKSTEKFPHLSFSAGRRICSGLNFAERSLFLTASMLLACFKIERPTDALLDMDTSPNVRNTPLVPIRHNVRLVPRHDNVSSFVN